MTYTLGCDISNMLPIGTIDNGLDGCANYAIFFRKFPLWINAGYILLANIANILRCQLGIVVTFTLSLQPRMTALVCHILSVVTHRTEKQVFRIDTPPIIAGVTDTSVGRQVAVHDEPHNPVGLFGFSVEPEIPATVLLAPAHPRPTFTNALFDELPVPVFPVYLGHGISPCHDYII